KRICLGLQRKDRDLLEHGLETGIIRQMPDGEFIEVHRPVSEEKRAVLLAKAEPVLLPLPGATDENGVPVPAGRGIAGKLRATANRVISESIPMPAGNGHSGNGHGNGHAAVEGNGHAVDGEAEQPVAVGDGSAQGPEAASGEDDA
ncbi:MAG TPA: hypothetical protein VGH27_03985, partial [Streptosporangiaceae bacterium]